MSESRIVIQSGGAGSELFLCERDSDVAIVVELGGTSWRYPAHKLILRSMSDVFRRMFDVDMKESTGREVCIRDSNPLAMKQFLRYLYIGSTEFKDWHEILELMTVAHKYDVHSLIHTCEKQLIECLKMSNACIMYEVSYLYSLESLKQEAHNIIMDAAFVISSTEGFFNLSMRSLETYLSSSRFNMENEGTVLTTLKDWARSECSRRCRPLDNDNILNVMEPLLKYIDFALIPESQRTFVPKDMAKKYSSCSVHRVAFFVPPTLHCHLNVLKFVVELGSFSTKGNLTEPLHCLKFCVDSHLFVVGFRMVGMFRSNYNFGTGSPLLMLGKEDSRNHVHFNLNSLPWKNGASVGDYVWKEMVAYLPHPARLDPFCTYVFSVKYGNMMATKWPKTRLESNTINTELGPVNFFSYGACNGITELFLLPAPTYRHTCNDRICS